jgi:hypothetical protein
MSQENVEVVRELVELWNSGVRDFTRFPEWLDSAIELEGPLSSVSGKPYHGHAGVEQWVRDVDDQFAQWTFRPDEIRAVGDSVIATGTLHMRGRASGAALQSPMASVHDFGSDHRITRWRIYRDVQEALKAVGLVE